MQWILRSLIGKLANLTPNVAYMSRTMAVEMNGIMGEWEVGNGPFRRGCSIMSASSALVAASSRHLVPGSRATVEIEGLEYDGERLGTYRVTIERMEDEQ